MGQYSSTIKGTVELAKDLREIPQYNSTPQRLDILLKLGPVPTQSQLFYAWNIHDKSENIGLLRNDRFTLYRFPANKSTDAIRGMIGFTRGLHVWEIIWPINQRGTHPVVGVATSDAPLHCAGYQNLVGSTDNSWGWNLENNKLCHNSKINADRPYPALLKPDETFIVPERFQVVLDMDEGTLAFAIDGQYLGVAFRNLKGLKLYPIISAVWGRCMITMKYIRGHQLKGPLPLIDLCCHIMCNRQKMETKGLEQLDLPESIRNYFIYNGLVCNSEE